MNQTPRTATPNTNTPILCAYEFDGQGRGLPLNEATAIAKLKADELAWVHLDRGHTGTRAWLEENVSYLDELILDALLAEETRPRMVEYKEGILIILRGVNLQEGAEPEDMISIRLWIDPHRIISTRIRKLKAVQDIREKLEDGTGPKDAGDFLAALTARLFQRMEPVIQELDERTDTIEETIIGPAPDSKACRHEIIDIRKMSIILRRYISPQREVMAALRSSEFPWITSHNKRQLQENHDRLTRYIEELDAVRDRAQIVKDELANNIAERMNKNMYILSLIAAIFLPLGFLTGMLGINVGGIPGADDPNAFYIFGAILIALVAGQLAIFKWAKWF